MATIRQLSDNSIEALRRDNQAIRLELARLASTIGQARPVASTATGHYIARLAGGQTVTGRAQTTPGEGQVWLQEIKQGELADLYAAATTVYNHGGQVAAPSGSDTYVEVTRDRQGRYWISRPAVAIKKGKADAEIAAGGSGTVSIWRAGADTGENVTAYLDWAEGTEPISAGKEVLLAENEEGKQQIIGAECESATYTETETDDLLDEVAADSMAADAFL